MRPKSITETELAFTEAWLPIGFASKTCLARAPLVCTFASANQNEREHAQSMLEKTKLILKQSRVILRSVIADSQYSDCKLRNAVEQAVITYRSNQKRDVEGLLIGTRSLELADQIIRKRSITRDPIWKRSAVF